MIRPNAVNHVSDIDVISIKPIFNIRSKHFVIICFGLVLSPYLQEMERKTMIAKRVYIRRFR